MNTLDNIAQTLKLAEHPSGHYVAKGDKLKRFLDRVGAKVALPKAFTRRHVELARSTHGNLCIRVPSEKGDRPGGPWTPSKGKWVATTHIAWDQRPAIEMLAEIDPIARKLHSGDSGLWAVLQDGGGWRIVPKTDVRDFLRSQGYPSKEVDKILGRMVGNPWEMVSLPFQPLEPGGRRMNFDGAQYTFQPAEALTEHTWPNGDVGICPTWDRVLRNCGRDLDDAVKAVAWTGECGILDGSDYLRMWIACLLREPLAHLPYLFFWGEAQDSGKSSFHESISLLMTRGVVSAKQALTNSNDFNGELHGGILAVVEELDLSRNSFAASRIKEWVTAESIWIRRMRTDLYRLPNTLHFVQTANGESHCLVEDEDTRIVVAHVDRLSAGDKIAKSILHEQLKAEAPNFMKQLFDLQLPPIQSRLRLPPLDSKSKARVIEQSMDPLVYSVCHLDFAGQHKLYFKDLEPLIGRHTFKRVRTAFDKLDRHAGSLARYGIKATYSDKHEEHGHSIILERTKDSA